MADRISHIPQRTLATKGPQYNTESVKTAETGGGGGGNMDDILKRLGTVEANLGDVRAQVSGLTAQVPHLATKGDIGTTNTAIQKVETSVIKWIVATFLGVAALAFAIARYVAPAG